MINSSYFRRFGASAIVLSALGLAACKSDSGESKPEVAQTVIVVSVDTPQNQLLSEIYAQSLEKGGFRVARRDPVKDLPTAYGALTGGVGDLFITHTAELLAYVVANEPAAASTSTTEVATTTSAAETTTTDTSADSVDTTADSVESTTDETAETTDGSAQGLLNRTTPSTDDTVEAATTTELSEPTQNSSEIPLDSTTTIFDPTATTAPVPGNAAATAINLQSNLIGEVLPDTLSIGAASDAEDKSVIACSNGVATTGSLVTLSDVANAADALRLSGPPSFETDEPFGLPGFRKVYGEVEFKEFIPLEPAELGGSITAPTTTIDTSVSTTVAPTTTLAPTTTVVGPTPTTEPEATTTTTIPEELQPDADCGAFNSLDVTMPNDAVIMDDDKHWIETNGVIPLLTTTANTPGVSQLVDQISQGLTTAQLRVMLAAMASDDVSPETMASRYIAQQTAGG